MDFCNEVVTHKIFGRGQIIEFENNYVTVLFDESKAKKKFVYPSAFGVFLEAENNLIINQIEEDKKAIAHKKAEDKRIAEEYAKEVEALNLKNVQKHSKNASSKKSNGNNIAFKSNYCDGAKCKESVGYKGVCSDNVIEYNVCKAKHVWCSNSESPCYQYRQGNISREELLSMYDKDEFVCYESQMLRLWRAYAGITQTGKNKGKPMTLKKVKINSLASLTTRLPNASEEDRFIFAVFLINEKYEADNNKEGYVEANSKYRMQLSFDEAKELKFWDYYFNPNNPEKIILGSGLHRYLTNIQAAQVLNKICEIKKDTVDENLSKEFLEYYCKLNGLDIDNIPVPIGALQRVNVKSENFDNK